MISLSNISANEEYAVLRVAQSTTTIDAIQQALVKAGKTDEQAENYVLVEDVQKGWDHRETDKGGGSQRVLDANENVLHAQSKWKGNGRFLLRKKSSDQSSRPWMTAVTKEQKRREGSLMSDHSPDWDSQVFLVCVHNVAEDQPYTILQAPMSSCAQDIVSQALAKARRANEARHYVLCEESRGPGATLVSSESTGRNPYGSVAARHHQVLQRQHQVTRLRVLADDENVHAVQVAWKNSSGKFTLMERQKVAEQTVKKDARGFLQRFSLSRMSSITGDRRQLRQLRHTNTEDDSQQSQRSSPEFSVSSRHHVGYRHLWDWRTTSRTSPSTERKPTNPYRRDVIESGVDGNTDSREDIAMVDVRPLSSSTLTTASRIKLRFQSRQR